MSLPAFPLSSFFSATEAFRKASASLRRSRWMVFLGVLAFLAGGAAETARASGVATSTALAISSGGTPVVTVSAGSTVTLTATVTAGSFGVMPGLVLFCDASATYCEDIHIVGRAQLTGSGVAVFKFRPSIGSHTYKAVFVGTDSYLTSTSSAMSLVVAGHNPSSTTFSTTGGLGSYNATATVTGTGFSAPAPTGTVSFLDTSNSNASLGQATLVAASSAFSISSKPILTLGSNSFAIIPGDFNLDGIPDIAVINNLSDTVSVLLGNGDGTFTTAASPATGVNPTGITTADFNSDGIPDLAIANFNHGLGNDGNITVLLGNGDGTFTATPISPSVGSEPQAIVAADFNGDGIPDLAVCNQGFSTVSILLGNGDGTFTATALPSNSVATGLEAQSIVAGDFNGDGKIDLATANTGSDTLTVLLGNGDGTFTAAASPSTGLDPNFVVAVDINGDGKTDLVVSNEQSNVTVLLGNGNGTFTAGTSFGYTQAITVGDFNGDGIADLAAEFGYQTTAFLGKGDGTFSTGPTFSPTSLPNMNETQFVGVAAADFNGDGLADLAAVGVYVLATEDPGDLLVLLSNDTTTATASTPITVSLGDHAVEASYSGDSNYSSSVSVTGMLAGPASTTLNLGISAGPYTFGQTITLTAMLSPYAESGYSTFGESISFYNGSTLLGTGTLSSGAATLSLSSPAAGSYSFSAAYAGDGKFLTSTSNTITASISPATPTVHWSTPSAITYGTVLSGTQLNATTSVPGTFVYSPVVGAVLTAGQRTLGVTFTPTDGTDYTTATSSVMLQVNKATPTITTKPAASAITYGQTLANSTLSGGSASYNSNSVPGTFAFTTPSTAPGAGTPSESATFTPTDTTDYTTATTTVNVTVNKATPTVIWPAASAITYGQTLASSTLSGGSASYNSNSVPGTFAFTTPSTAPGAGTPSESATFTPTDTTDYTTATTTVNVTVNKATPTVIWPAASAITYGQTLASSTLSGGSASYNSNSVPGTFAFTTPSTAPGVGTPSENVTFTPTDTTDYNTVSNNITVMVNPVPNPVPTISSLSPAFVSAGGAGFTLTVNGTGFVSGSTFHWGGTALTTTYVSATQLTAQVPATNVVSSGTASITVQTPTPGGGTSNALLFEIDPAASGSGNSPVFGSASVAVTAGSNASYAVTLPTSASSISVTCLNLPAGAACSYSSSTNSVTITTSSSTPKGTYQIIVVFTETITATTGMLLPLLLLPLAMRRQRSSGRIWPVVCAVLLLISVASVVVGCGGGISSGSSPHTSTQQATSSGAVNLTVQ